MDMTLREALDIIKIEDLTLGQIAARKILPSGCWKKVGGKRRPAPTLEELGYREVCWIIEPVEKKRISTVHITNNGVRTRCGKPIGDKQIDARDDYPRCEFCDIMCYRMAAACR